MAGKSSAQPRSGPPGRDHPRVGGEKFRTASVRATRSGSPPRGRGKVHPFLHFFVFQGITPAWAGKSFLRVDMDEIPGDHPRVGGEKFPPCRYGRDPRGSPPRGRGKDLSLTVSVQHARITPAWAGKSYRVFRCGHADEDHPRVGGEKLISTSFSMPASGSPPRGRGKGSGPDVDEKHTGITPAWAGKSRCLRICLSRLWDHPRVGGEKRRFHGMAAPFPGSPPRGRGKDPGQLL